MLNSEIIQTITNLRIEMADTFDRNFEAIDRKEAEMLKKAHPDNVPYIKHLTNMLKNDLKELNEYRLPENSDSVEIATFCKWFGDTLPLDCFDWLDTKRDYIYNAHGLRLLKNRYLRPREPIQYCMLRIAMLFTPREKKTLIDFDKMQNAQEIGDNFSNGIDLRILECEAECDAGNNTMYNLIILRVMYDAISCGFMHTSSILADADHADPTIVPGEACRLLVANPNYNRDFVKQANEICNLVSLGVGVGMSATTVPLLGSNVNGLVRSGFRSFAKKMDSCNYLTIYERKPKIAIYIEMHNDTIYEAFELRNPIKNHLENLFVGVMISNYFIECYENDLDWYLFPSDAMLDGNRLCDFYGENYKKMYKRFVDAKLYSRRLPSSKLMDDLVTCIAETGSPYVVWSDNVNKFSNHRHLGKIKTLNLCAEIANYASVERSSSCTLMSVNFAMYRDFPKVLQSLYKFVEVESTFLEDYCGLNICADNFEFSDMSKFAYAMGFISTLALNHFMGEKREYRELGVSPLGVYDMATIGNVDPIDMVAPVSEALYKGCIEASCRYYKSYNVKCKYYKKSPFSEGRPQWSLRGLEPSTPWSMTTYLMQRGMANSQLTAQAPTATTSMLIGVAESVTLPMSILMARESENGRNDLMCYGLISNLLTNPEKRIDLQNDLDRQLLMYSKSAPYIDQSQSTMFSLVLTRQNILDLLMNTYYCRLKTAIYYTQPLQINQTLRIVRQSAKRKCDTSNDIVCLRRKTSCDGCSG